MIKVLRLKKGVYAIILGVIALVAYSIVSADDPEEGMYLLQIAGVCFFVGALLFLLPIVLAKKDNKGKVQLDPEKRAAEAAEAEASQPIV
jgi:hypothetical protein